MFRAVRDFIAYLLSLPFAPSSFFAVQPGGRVGILRPPGRCSRTPSESPNYLAPRREYLADAPGLLVGLAFNIRAHHSPFQLRESRRSSRPSPAGARLKISSTRT